MKVKIPDSKKDLAEALGISRSLMYYEHKLPAKDWQLKCEIEKVMRKHPSYGHKRLAIHLAINKKRILRVMKKFGIKPYRRRGKRRKYKKSSDEEVCENLLLQTMPTMPHQIWVSDFTEIIFQGKKIYIATVEDLFTRQIVGFCVLTNHSVQLVMNALLSAIMRYPTPAIIHSDRGSEYKSKTYKTLLKELNIKQSMSAAGCPWENGYQESFYGKMKTDLGDPNRFETLGELVYEIYKTIYNYNNSRIHTALKMPPTIFANQFTLLQSLENVSKKRGT